MEFMALLRTHNRGDPSPNVINLTRPIRETHKDYFVVQDQGKYFVETQSGDGPGFHIGHSRDDLSTHYHKYDGVL